MLLRKIALCVEAWWSEENLFAWNFLRKRLLQEGPSSCFNDRIYIVHVTAKGKEVENWDKGTAVLGDVRTELAGYDHSITELHGDVVSCIVQFIAQEGIHIAILSLKDVNRVKKTLSMGAANQILTRACCACTIVSPRFSAGDHFRIQAKLQPDALVANSATQFRRRVAVVLNSPVWDSALAQYVAKNVILPGDRVILVRCLNENLNKKNTEELQVERDYLRELGWHKFRRTDVALAVEVIKSHTRALCDFIEEKGVDLLIMTRSETNKLKRSITKENACFQTFPHRCPCPFMIVPTAILRGVARRATSSLGEVDLPSTPFMNTPNSPGLFSKKSWSSAFQRSSLRIFGSRRCQSMDISDNSQRIQTEEYLAQDDSIELSKSAIPDLDGKAPEIPWKHEGIPAGSPKPISEEPEESAVVDVDEGDSQKEAVVRRLQRKLSEKEKEIMYLKQRILHLQKS